jgi:hypothetical protein
MKLSRYIHPVLIQSGLPSSRAPCSDFKVNGVNYVVFRNAYFFLHICARVADLWTGCQMVTESARHRPPNGGIERFNRTIQAKVNFSSLYICLQRC